MQMPSPVAGLVRQRSLTSMQSDRGLPFAGGCHDFLRRQADAFVIDVHPAVAGAEGDPHRYVPAVGRHLSKRVLHTLTRIMAVEFAPEVRVNAIAPGLILPPPGKDVAYLEGLAHSNPLHKHGGAADVVTAALYLLHAEFVTGQTLFVDGGRHLRGSMYE